MADTTTKEYQDKQTKKALKKRDANMKENRNEHRKVLQEAYNDVYDKALEIMDKLKK